MIILTRQLKMQKLNRMQRPAFTLVELLVVIAIIGILVGLLLPAVQAAREAARRASCVNNMMQLGLAVHHFEFNAEHLPAGVLNPTGPIRNEPIGQHVSWIVQILPFMEEKNVYKQFDLSKGAYAVENQPARNHAIPLLLCPSSPQSRGAESPLATYAGCYHGQEAPIDQDNNGLLFLNSKVRFSDIEDGSSYTILIGEALHDEDDLGWVSGTRATLRNTSVMEGYVAHPSVTPKPAAQSLHVGGFGSYHTGGGNFVFADGSVRFISSNIETPVFHLYGSRADGEIIEHQ